MAIGVGRLWQTRHAPRVAWNMAKNLGTLGLALSMLQWSVFFLSVGGEWFLMWQSRIWNGQEAAFRNFAIMGITLVILQLHESDETSGT
jgi:predicted small integral membrane protein